MSLYNLLALQEALIYKRKHSGFRALRGCLVGGHTSPRHASLRHTFVALFLAATVCGEICPAFIWRNSVWAKNQAAALCMWQPQLWRGGVWLQTKQTLTFSPSFPAGIVDLDSFPFPFDVDLLGSILKVTSCFTRIHSRATR